VVEPRAPSSDALRDARVRGTRRSIGHLPATREFALDTIELAALFHDDGETRLATELRARQKVMGITWDALRDQRIRYVDAEISDSAGQVG
jgi:hypothetical protein